MESCTLKRLAVVVGIGATIGSGMAAYFATAYGMRNQLEHATYRVDLLEVRERAAEQTSREIKRDIAVVREEVAHVRGALETQTRSIDTTNQLIQSLLFREEAVRGSRGNGTTLEYHLDVGPGGWRRNLSVANLVHKPGCERTAW